MKAYSAWYDRHSKQLLGRVKESYRNIDHIRMVGSLMSQQYHEGDPDLPDGVAGPLVWVAWDERGVHQYLGIFTLDGQTIEPAELDHIEQLAATPFH